MSAHDHREYVDGCFRCDLSRDEVNASNEVELTKAEREALAGILGGAAPSSLLTGTVEAIIAARLESVERERDEAEAALANLRAKGEALADEWQRDQDDPAVRLDSAWIADLRALLDGA